jgi:hypothetical protein
MEEKLREQFEDVAYNKTPCTIDNEESWYDFTV